MSIKLGSDPNSIGSFDAEPMLDMNTTPLIDVMLVLLVMLIITIPMQLHSVNMNMPKAANSQPLTKPQVIKIDVNAGNQIVWNGVVLTGKEQLQLNFDRARDAASSVDEQPEIHIKPSDTAKYENVAAVLAAAQRSGLKKIGIVSAAANQS